MCEVCEIMITYATTSESNILSCKFEYVVKNKGKVFLKYFVLKDKYPFLKLHIHIHKNFKNYLHKENLILVSCLFYCSDHINFFYIWIKCINIS